jgi:hypothetical protein
LSWIVAQGIGTALIDPGKPWQNLSITHNFCPHDGTQPDVREA